MKVGIAGFAGSGKTVAFQWLTGVAPDMSKSQTGQSGNAKVPDSRLDWLSAKFKPKKTTPAAIDFLDTPGLLTTERKDNPRRLAILREASGLLVVLNGYNESDLAGQLARFREEMMFADLEIITNRIGRIEETLKKPRPAKEKEPDEFQLTILRRLQEAMEANHPPTSVELKEDEEKSIRAFQLLTLKPELVLVNLGDDRIGQPIAADLLALAPTAVQAPVKLELDLHELPESDRQEMMEGYGLTSFQRDEMIRTVFAAMGQIVFFTIGEDECRAWPIPSGADAVEGASQIHTDLARGFVRAEVVRYEDFKRVGSMKEAKSQGVYRLEGKTYIVADGDIMHILASS
jgi:ribosome-binding ATPase YchF (GTP1/OBG family)